MNTSSSTRTEQRKRDPDIKHDQTEVQRLGTKSIFYDAEWNPEGEAPSGYRNVPYNPFTFKSRVEIKPELLGLEDIPLPPRKDGDPK